MTRLQIAEAFANGATKGKANSMFIDGDVIFSYGYHFPIAVRLNSNTAVFTSRNYSRTTSMHKGFVRRALETAGYTLTLKELEREDVLGGYAYGNR
jgi:hypothetical protein